MTDSQELTINRVDLWQALKKLRGVAGVGKAALPLYFFPYGIGKVGVAAHNSGANPTLSMVCIVNGDTSKFSEAFVVNSHKVWGFVNAARHDIVIRVRKRASFNSGQSSAQLGVGSTRFFPDVLSPPESGHILSTTHAKIKGMLSVSSLADTDSQDHMRSAVALMFTKERFQAIATDSFRVGYAWEDVKCDKSIGVICLAETINILQDNYWTGPLSIYIEGSNIFFKADDFYVYGRLSALPYEKYPVKSIIGWMRDDIGNGFTISPDNIRDELRACAYLSGKERYVRVRCTVANHKLILEASGDEGRDQMVFTINLNKQIGKDHSFFVNSIYVEGIIAMLEKISNGGLDNVNFYMGKETGFIFCIAPGISARFAFAQMTPDV